jgi:hypothetical protein
VNDTRELSLIASREIYSLTVRTQEYSNDVEAFVDGEVDYDWDGDGYRRCFALGTGSDENEAIENWIDAKESR